MALSSPSFFCGLATLSNRNRRSHKFRCSTSVVTTNCCKQGEFQYVLTDYVSPNQFPASRTDRQSTILHIQDSSDLASALARFRINKL